MRPPYFVLASLIACATLGAAPAAVAQKADPAPKPDTYLCPHVTGSAIDCYLDAVEHLYTMCRHIKSIEIIEFGYEKSDEGVNGAKTAYCIEKHELSMKRPLQTAVREAGKRRSTVDALQSLHVYWLGSLAELKWAPGESDEAYKSRVAKPYGVFQERAMLVRLTLQEPVGKATKTAPAAPTKSKSPN
ncbi:MAG: hypothetical protein ABI724_14325 [Betaproteobacteria bacterium]